MDETYDIPQDTREFLAQWNAATEAHLSAKLTAILEQIVASGLPLEDVSPQLYELLAPFVLRGLQVASQPGATVHDAIAHLEGLVSTK